MLVVGPTFLPVALFVIFPSQADAYLAAYSAILHYLFRGDISGVVTLVWLIVSLVVMAEWTGERQRNRAAKKERKRQLEQQVREQAIEAERKKEEAGKEFGRQKRALARYLVQWQVQDEKGEPRDPTAITVIKLIRWLEGREARPEEKVWLVIHRQKIEAEERERVSAEQQAAAEADRQRAAQLKATQEHAARDTTERQRKAEENRRAAEAEAIAKRQVEEALQASMWRGTGGPPGRDARGTDWIRETWRREDKDFTPWLVRELHLVSACTGLDLRHGRMEVSAGGGRADIVARDYKSKSNVVIENQLDAADLDHRKQLALYGEALNARIRIWIAADFSSTIRREVRKQNRQNESRSDGVIYYLLKLRPDRRSPLALIVGPANSQAHPDFTDMPLMKRNKEGING